MEFHSGRFLIERMPFADAPHMMIAVRISKDMALVIGKRRFEEAVLASTAFNEVGSRSLANTPWGEPM
jgi:hypothetical protein